MKIDDSIIKLYLKNEPTSKYSNHWIYSTIREGENCFCSLSVERVAEVKNCYEQIVEICSNFTFRNADLVYKIFDNVTEIMQYANVLFTVGLPPMYDAMVQVHEGMGYVIIDLINFCDYIDEGKNISDLIENFLSHELIHILINAKYPLENFSYVEYIDFIAFHEGFAHLLSYKENIAKYQADNTYREKFNIAKDRLIKALYENDPILQKQYSYEANSGKYWDKFASISSMLYLMKHIDSLKEIYELGWRGYTKLIVNYDWKHDD